MTVRVFDITGLGAEELIWEGDDVDDLLYQYEESLDQDDVVALRGLELGASVELSTGFRVECVGEQD